MITSIHAPGTSDFRLASPLCTSEFAKPPSALRPAIPPRWMHQGLIWSLLGAVVCTVAVLLSPMDEYVNAPGEVRPADLSLVFSKSDGILESVSVVDGQSVERGQLLARLDPWEMQKSTGRIEDEIRQATAELDLAAANSRKVEAAPVPHEFLFSGLEVERQQDIQDLQQDYMRRLSELQKTGAASGTEILNLRMQIIASEALLKRSQKANQLFTGVYGQASREEAGAKEAVAAARLKSLESDLLLARQDLQRLDILAPENGVILSTARRFPGEKVSAGEAMFKITGNTGTELRLYATEDRVDRIKVGQIVRFRANNNPDRLAQLALGRVTGVALDRDLRAEDSAQAPTASYRIKVAIEKVPYPLAVGATVQAEIVIDRRPFWRFLFLRSTTNR